MRRMLQVVLCMGLLVVALSSLAMGEVSVAKEFTLPSYQGSPFRPRINGNWVLAVQNADNKGCGSTATGVIIYSTGLDKSYTIYQGNAGWCDIGGHLAVWTGKTENLRGFCTLKGDRSGSRSIPSNLIVTDTNDWKMYIPELTTGPAFAPVAWEDYVAYEGKGGQIYIIDMKSGAQTQISKGSVVHRGPAIGPDLVVWEEYTDKRQIRGYRISTGEQIEISNDAGAEHCSPRTDGKTVVWWGKSEGVAAYDVATGKRTAVSPHGFYADVDNGIVVYLRTVAGGGNGVYGYDLASGREFRITSRMADQGPSIDHNRVIWGYKNEIHCAMLQP